MLQLANFYENTKQPEKAEKAFRDVLSTAKNLHGGEEMKDQYAIHYLRMCRIQLAQLLRERKPQEANSLKEESIATRASLLTADPNQDCNFLISLGDLCLNLRDYENAEKVLREAENVANSTKPPLKDWVTVVSTRKRALYKAAK
jgi:tetratricopeptide (TPR) repeat protein